MVPYRAVAHRKPSVVPLVASTLAQDALGQGALTFVPGQRERSCVAFALERGRGFLGPCPVAGNSKRLVEGREGRARRHKKELGEVD